MFTLLSRILSSLGYYHLIVCLLSTSRMAPEVILAMDEGTYNGKVCTCKTLFFLLVSWLECGLVLDIIFNFRLSLFLYLDSTIYEAYLLGFLECM